MQSEPSSLVDVRDLCRCGHTGRTHPYTQGVGFTCINHGCDCRAFEKQSVPIVINNRCKCSHDRFRHNWGSEADGACSKPDCDCGAYAPVTVETVELPEAEVHECDNCEGVDPDSCLTRLPPPEGPEYTPCVCGHIEPKHHTLPPHRCLECECCVYQTEFDARRAWALPPQPERRPPLSVAYSVAGGHPYEVSIPGDASVTAEDGVLIIKHPEAQILAITRVAPLEG